MSNELWGVDRRTDYLVHQELQELVLHLWNPADFRLDLDTHLHGLIGEQRTLAYEIIESYRQDRADPAFVLLASALETSTRNFQFELEATTIA